MKKQNQTNGSKDIIKDALFKLMDEKDYAEITMSEIAKESGLVRMTVYRHFKEKSHIIIYAFESDVKDVLMDENKLKKDDLNDLLEFRFRRLKDSPYTKLLAEYNLLDGIFEKVEKEKLSHFNVLLPKMDNEYIYKFVIGGIDNITKEWILDGMKESCETVANKVSEIINKLNQS